MGIWVAKQTPRVHVGDAHHCVRCVDHWFAQLSPARGLHPNVAGVEDMYAAVMPVGNVVRVAGTAEFAGFDESMRPERIRNLVRLATQILRQAQLDPATPD